MPRRGENIYKRKDGRWEGRLIAGRKPDGSARYRSVYGRSYSELKIKLKSAKSTIPKAKANDSTFGYYTQQWLQTVKLKCKQSTYNKYHNICKNHIVPILGEFKVQELSSDDISGFLSSKTELAPKTLNDILCVIKMIYSYAAVCGCSGSLCMNTVSVRVPKKQMRVLSVQEQKKLTDYLLTDTDLYKLGTYLTLCTGVRIGELCALRRCDISFDNNTIHIGTTMQRVQTDDDTKKTEVIITEPKSRCSVRDIPVSGKLLELMHKHYSKLPNEAFLLSGSSERFVEPCMMRYHFAKQIKACDISDVKFHTLRHSFATRCVESGMDIRTLSEILGHENVNITLNRYVHSSMEHKRESIEKLYSSTAYSP